MQCLLYSVGVGGSSSIPAAAAIAWVLKDGVGQFGGMLFASLVATRFDVSPLRYRMASAIVLDLSVALEMLTPLVPHLFLPLAALANTGKNIAWLGAAASRAAIHRSLLRRENLADVTAKSGSQTILASLFGTALGIGLSMLTGSNTHAILLCFVALSTSHLLATYRALKDVVINQLHEKRIQKLSLEYIQQLEQQQGQGQRSPGHGQPLQFQFHLSSPAAIQRSEPLFFRLRTVAAASRGAAPAGSSSASREPWTNSSLNTSPEFERLVAQLLLHPELHLSSEEIARASSSLSSSASGSTSSSASSTSPPLSAHALYESWLGQFESLPFVASLQLLSEEQAVHDLDRSSADDSAPDYSSAGWRQKLTQISQAAQTVWQRSANKGRYASVPSAASSSSPSSSSPALPRLHIRLLFKSGCTSEQLLVASLYTTFLRARWAAAQMGVPSTSSSSSSSASTRLQRLHAEALQLLRTDTDANNGVNAAVMASDHAAALSCALTPTPPSFSLLHSSGPSSPGVAIAPSPSASSSISHPASRFVHELRLAGFQTELHFVQDDNPVRIQLHSLQGRTAAEARV